MNLEPPLPADAPPVPLTSQRLPQPAPARVLACGAWLKNTACLIDGDMVYHSPLHGDLGTVDSRQALQASVAALLQRASGPIAAVAHDLHPDFYSTELAQQLAARLGVPAIAVQHHHAHLAQVAAQQLPQGPVLGWALDGVGLGTDQTAWGGELLWADGVQFERLAHLPVLHLPGGDVAAREPWRMAVALLHRLGLGHQAAALLADANGLQAGAVKAISAPLRQGVQTLLQRGLNCPTTTSTGRWFDAVAGLLGLCWWQEEEAQAAIALERTATQWLAAHPAPTLDAELIAAGLDLAPLVQRLLTLLADAGPDAARRAAAQGQAAALFHLALADALAQAAIAQAQRLGVATVVLGGGCFYNRLLRERMRQTLTPAGLDVRLAWDMNVGDAGLALGQAWVAAHQIAQVATSINNMRSTVCV